MSSSAHRTLRRSARDRALQIITNGSAATAVVVLLLIVLFLCVESRPALQRIGVWRFATDDGWYPTADRFNVLPIVAGTVLTTIGAVIIAAPSGIASAVLTCFYAPPVLAGLYRKLVELLAGIPSVVFGLWGLVSLVPLLADRDQSGQGLLVASIVLSLMILPMVALTAMTALQNVPAELIAGGAALGLRRSTIVWRIVLPAARRGMITGILLATCRALGETMAVVMVAGNVVQFPDSISAPVRTLTANMALEMGYATSSHRSVLFVSGLLLLMASMGVVMLLTGSPRQRTDS